MRGKEKGKEAIVTEGKKAKMNATVDKIKEITNMLDSEILQRDEIVEEWKKQIDI